MSATLRILGSGTAIPHPARGASGYAVVATDGSALLLECGPGSTRRWPAHGLTFETVAGILVTHHHVDHVGDLAAVLFGRNVPEPRVKTALSLLGPNGHAELVRGLRTVYGPTISDRAGVVEIVELADGDSHSFGEFSVEVRVVRHSPGALGVRVTCGGRVLAFSGDSGPCDALSELFAGADLVLCECSYPAGRASRSHLNAATAAQTAVAAGVQRLVLTHFYAQCDGVDIESQVREAGYDAELWLAADGDVHAI